MWDDHVAASAIMQCRRANSVRPLDPDGRGNSPPFHLTEPIASVVEKMLKVGAHVRLLLAPALEGSLESALGTEFRPASDCPVSWQFP